MFHGESLTEYTILREEFMCAHRLHRAMTRIRCQPGTQGRKRTLFCHGCGFEGDMQADFLVDPAADHLEYVCPECSELLSRRPNSTE